MSAAVKMIDNKVISSIISLNVIPRIMDKYLLLGIISPWMNPNRLQDIVTNFVEMMNNAGKEKIRFHSVVAWQM